MMITNKRASIAIYLQIFKSLRYLEYRLGSVYKRRSQEMAEKRKLSLDTEFYTDKKYSLTYIYVKVPI